MIKRVRMPLAVLLLAGLCPPGTGADHPRSQPAEAGGPRAPVAVPVIFDTDIGYDIDDTWALAFLLASPELDLKLVLTDAQNTIGKAAIVAKFLEAAGRTDVPVGIGLKRGETIGPQSKWITDYELSRYPGKVHEDGKLMHVAMAWKDLAAFERLVAERIAGYRPPTRR